MIYYFVFFNCKLYNRAYQLWKGINETQLDKYFKGRYSVRSHSNMVTDSANGAFVFASGGITNNGYIGVDKYT